MVFISLSRLILKGMKLSNNKKTPQIKVPWALLHVLTLQRQAYAIIKLRNKFVLIVRLLIRNFG